MGKGLLDSLVAELFQAVHISYFFMVNPLASCVVATAGLGHLHWPSSSY